MVLKRLILSAFPYLRTHRLFPVGPKGLVLLFSFPRCRSRKSRGTARARCSRESRGGRASKERDDNDGADDDENSDGSAERLREELLAFAADDPPTPEVRTHATDNAPLGTSRSNEGGGVNADPDGNDEDETAFVPPPVAGTPTKSAASDPRAPGADDPGSPLNMDFLSRRTEAQRALAESTDFATGLVEAGAVADGAGRGLPRA